MNNRFTGNHGDGDDNTVDSGCFVIVLIVAVVFALSTRNDVSKLEKRLDAVESKQTAK